MESFVSGKFTPSARLGARATQYLMFGHTETFFQAQRATPAQALSQKVSYIKKQCASWGPVVQAATLAVQKAEEEGIQVQSLPGCGRRSLPGPCLENLSQNKTQRLQYPSYCPLGCKSWLF